MNWKHSLHVGILRAGLQLAASAAWLVLAPGLSTPVQAAAFGTVVPIGGQAADIALDEGRGLLYIANFTANRIDVMSLSDNTVHTSMNVAPQPGSIALSPDGNYLLVAHFGNYVKPGSPVNALTLINLGANNAKQTFALGYPPLGVAFGINNKALVVTSNDFILFDPVNGQTTVVDTISNVTANTLPVAPAKFPPQIIAASMNVSADGFHIYGLTDTIRFHYNLQNGTISSLGYTASPPLGPRVVSVSRDGSSYTAGWALFSANGPLIAQFDNAAGTLNVGTHSIDSSAGLIYAQIPEGTAQSTAVPPLIPATPSAPQATPVAPPVLQVVAADNLAVQQKLQLPENLAGKSLLTAKGDMLYSVSDSGVTVLPVGYLNQLNRVQPSKPDMVFRGDFCDRTMVTQEITILDPGGNRTDFALIPDTPGVMVSPSSGVTPAVVQVTVDPNVFQNQNGTVEAHIDIQSFGAVNLPDPIRVLINNRQPEQRGTFVDVPGKIVDIAADPVRNRFYLLRQDQNQILVYDSTTNTQIAVLRTSNTPTTLAITHDRKYLLAGHENSQLAYVYDLDTLKPSVPIVFPFGHYPHSIAVSSRAVLAAVRVAGSTHVIDSVDVPSRTANQLPTLGIFQNSVNIDTVVASAPSGGSILAASVDGTTLLYDANANTFTAGRKDFSALQGAFAASDYGQYLVDNHLLNSSLVPIAQLDASTGASSGFAFLDQTALRTTGTPISSAAGVIQRVNTTSGDGIRPTRIVEGPITKTRYSNFTHTLAPLSDRSGIVSLTTSGFTVLSWNYDVAVASPKLNAVVNAADFTQSVAPGGLISLFGTNLSPTNMATNEVPLPTALGDSCLTLNGAPIPMLFVSGGQVNAQLPFDVAGNAVMVLHTPGGVSDNFNVTIQTNAPSVFRSGTAGPQSGIPTVVRASNNQLVTLSNPVHAGDELVIYATGLGQVSPNVKAGDPSPSKPLALTLVPPIVTLSNATLPVHYSGLAPGFVGVYQINVGVPIHPETGFGLPLTISQGGVKTTMQVRVVR
jgi:uncharacterized protein (TIGR03437 family)